MFPSSILFRRLTSSQEIRATLSKPTWSVGELFAKDPCDHIAEKPTRNDISHLLKLAGLSALSNDSSSNSNSSASSSSGTSATAKEEKLLEELHRQLVFVGHIAAVDTQGIEPLVRISGQPLEPNFEDLWDNETSAQQPVVAKETVPPNNWKPTDLAKKSNGPYYTLDTSLGAEN